MTSVEMPQQHTASDGLGLLPPMGPIVSCQHGRPNARQQFAGEDLLQDRKTSRRRARRGWFARVAAGTFSVLAH